MILKVHLGLEHGTLSAHGDLFFPILFHVVVADGAVDEPAEVARVEFPRRTRLPDFFGALTNVPANLPARIVFLGKQKEKLAFHMDGDVAPSLLVAAYCFERSTEQLGELLLGFGQLFSDGGKFVFFHDKP